MVEFKRISALTFFIFLISFIGFSQNKEINTKIDLDTDGLYDVFNIKTDFYNSSMTKSVNIVTGKGKEYNLKVDFDYYSPLKIIILENSLITSSDSVFAEHIAKNILGFKKKKVRCLIRMVIRYLW